MNLESRIDKYLREYVATVTHTSSSLENNNIKFFESYFGEVDYFKNKPDQWGFYEIKGDYLGRRIPWGLLKGSGEDTVVLIHHTDTVDIEDYGAHQKWAYRPYDLTQHYKDSGLDLEPEIQSDLDSEKWLFGRGVADMKGGAAIHLALLEEYSKDENFKGNLIILGLPDEENLSAGMRSAAYLLEELRHKHHLNYCLMLNVEPHERTDKDQAVIYDGSVGKLMPVVYVKGKLAHVGQVFRGFNPINLLSEIVRRTELNPDFIERVGNTTTPPPAWLYMKDRKDVYDVSLPLAAAGYMSVLTLDRPPKEIFEQLESICIQAFEEVIADMNKSYSQFLKLSGFPPKNLQWKPLVKSYDVLYQEALRDSGEAFTQAMMALMDELKAQILGDKISMAEGAYRMIERTLEFVQDGSPVVVIALAPPYYPNVNNRMLDGSYEKINQLMENLMDFAKEDLDYGLGVQNYYTGISDLSYAMFAENQENISYIENNMLLWGDLYSVPLETIKDLSMPVLNIGPWGKDFHKYTERVLMEDLFYHTPRLIDKTIKTILQHNN